MKKLIILCIFLIFVSCGEKDSPIEIDDEALLEPFIGNWISSCSSFNDVYDMDIDPNPYLQATLSISDSKINLHYTPFNDQSCADTDPILYIVIGMMGMDTGYEMDIISVDPSISIDGYNMIHIVLQNEDQIRELDLALLDDLLYELLYQYPLPLEEEEKTIDPNWYYTKQD